MTKNPDTFTTRLGSSEFSLLLLSLLGTILIAVGYEVGLGLLRGIFGRGGFFAVPVRFGRNVRILESRTEREGEKRAAGLTTLSQIS